MKPSKKAFVTYRLLVEFIYSAPVFLTLYFVINYFSSVSASYFIAGLLLWQLFTWYSLSVRYKKEKYTFYHNRIVRNGGGIFSESRTELIIRKITQVTMKLPYAENRLMKTGSISIQSAGADAAEVRLSSISEPEKIHSYVQEVMKSNGFKLTKSNPIQTETPKTAAVFLEASEVFFAMLFAVFCVVAPVFSLRALGLDQTFGIDEVLGNATVLILPGSIVVIGIFAAMFFLRFMYLKRRVYNVYDGVITYGESFFSKTESFIPVENLSDSELKQTFVDRIFGIYDLKISCQGSRHEIYFRNIANGCEMENNIGRMINNAKSPIPAGRDGEELRAKRNLPGHSLKNPAPPDTRFTATYRMDARRTLTPFLIALPFCLITVIPMVPWLILLARRLIAVKSTTYLIKAKSVESRYSFMSQKNFEFANEKITGIVFTENALDKRFGTCSITFWSIGSSRNVKFSNVSKTPALYESITAKTGIRSQEPLYTMTSHFSFLRMLKANALLHLGALIAVAGLIILVISIDSILSDISEISTDLLSIPNQKNVISNVLTIINLLLIIVLKASTVFYFLTLAYKSNYYKRSKLTFYRHHVHFEEGVEFFNRQLFKRHHYADYDSIKNITTIRHPLSELGKVTLNVAGETLTKEGKKDAKKKKAISNGFAINYVDGMDVKNELLDIIFHDRPASHQISGIEQKIHAYAKRPVMTVRPDLINCLINPPVVLGVSLISAMLIVLGRLFDTLTVITLIACIPAILILATMIIRAREYVIQPHRVVAKSGILYKKQVSILFAKVDHINLSQGNLNRIFRTGNVSVNTTGSSRPEMVIRNLKDFRQFYDILKKHY